MVMVFESSKKAKGSTKNTPMNPEAYVNENTFRVPCFSQNPAATGPAKIHGLCAVESRHRLLGLSLIASVPDLLMRASPAIRTIVAAWLLSTAFGHAAFATSAEPAKDVKADPAPCTAAISAPNDDMILSVCGELLDHDRLTKPDRIKALIARAGVFERKGNTARAIDDYDDVLRLDPTLADIFSVRGELFRRR